MRLSNINRGWHKRWFVVTNEAIGYFASDSSHFKEYNYFTQYFKLKIKGSKTLTLRFGYRTLYLKFDDEFEFIDTIYCILEAYKSFMEKQNFKFTRSLTGNDMKFYINGESNKAHYFEDLYDAIEDADTEVYITDWFLAPQIWLKRPMEDFPEARLDLTLLRACKRGVKVN